MGTLGLVLNSAVALVGAHLLFMVTAFGGGGLVAPGKTPLSRAISAYLTGSLVAGPALCVIAGVAPWFLASASWAWIAAAPALFVVQVLVLLRLMSRQESPQRRP